MMLVRAAARACVTCDSATACQVRSGIFHPDFAHMLFLILAPFPLFAALGAAIYFAFPLPGQEPG